jgi:hypothetical protein
MVLKMLIHVKHSSRTSASKLKFTVTNKTTAQQDTFFRKLFKTYRNKNAPQISLRGALNKLLSNLVFGHWFANQIHKLVKFWCNDNFGAPVLRFPGIGAIVGNWVEFATTTSS